MRCGYRWLADDATLLCTEERELRFGAADGARTVDVDVTLRPAAAPLVLGDTKEGTFGRVHEALRVDGSGGAAWLVESEGRRDGAVWGKLVGVRALLKPDEEQILPLLRERVVGGGPRIPHCFAYPPDAFDLSRTAGGLADREWRLHRRRVGAIGDRGVCSRSPRCIAGRMASGPGCCR